MKKLVLAQLSGTDKRALETHGPVGEHECEGSADPAGFGGGTRIGREDAPTVAVADTDPQRVLVVEARQRLGNGLGKDVIGEVLLIDDQPGNGDEEIVLVGDGIEDDPVRPGRAR